jgi:hypothetical protein
VPVIAVSSVVCRDVVFATPPAHTVRCCKRSLDRAVCTAAMSGIAAGRRGRGTRSWADAFADDCEDEASDESESGKPSQCADAPGSAAAVAAGGAPVDKAGQFAVFLFASPDGLPLLDILPWQSVAVLPYPQLPCQPAIIRCQQGGADYQAIHDYSKLALPGTRPTVVGRDGVVQVGEVLDVIERLRDDDQCEPVFYCAHVRLLFERWFAGLDEFSLTVLTFGEALVRDDAVRIAIAILVAAPAIIVTIASGDEHPLCLPLFLVEAALKLHGAAFFWHFLSPEAAVCTLKPWDGSHYDAKAGQAWTVMSTNPDPSWPDVSKSVVTASIRRADALPRMKVKRHPATASVVAWFGTGSRTADAKKNRRRRKHTSARDPGRGEGSGRGRGQNSQG